MDITNLIAKDIMRTPVISTKKDTPASEVALQLVSNHISGMPVIDDEERVIGVITEYDLLNQVRQGNELGKLFAEDVMQKHPITIVVDTPISYVLDVMLDSEILRIPVTDGLRLVGVISRSTILSFTLGNT